MLVEVVVSDDMDTLLKVNSLLISRYLPYMENALPYQNQICISLFRSHTMIKVRIIQIYIYIFLWLGELVLSCACVMLGFVKYFSHACFTCIFFLGKFIYSVLLITCTQYSIFINCIYKWFLWFFSFFYTFLLLLTVFCSWIVVLICLYKQIGSPNNADPYFCKQIKR